MKGKDRCKILKDIRKRIAEENDIEFITSECKHKGDCLGTCPKCESELRYLERELENRRRLGKTVTVAGLALSVTLATTSCIPELIDKTTAGDMMPPQSSAELFSEVSDGEMIPLMGETEPVLMGAVPLPESYTDEETPDIPGELVIPEDSETDAPESVEESEETEETEEKYPVELMGDMPV